MDGLHAAGSLCPFTSHVSIQPVHAAAAPLGSSRARFV